MFKTVTLGSVCDFVNGKAFKPSDWSTAGVPIVRIQNLNGSNSPFNYFAGDLANQVQIRTGDLLLAWSGTPGTSFGAHIWRGGDAILNQHIFRCDIDGNVITSAWAKFVINKQLNQLIGQAHGGVGLKHVTRGVVEDLKIPLPALSEQKRIAEVLDQAEALRAKRRAALAQLDTLTQSIFLDLFGDPVSNPKRWSRSSLGDLLTAIDSGSSPVCLDRPAINGEWGVLKLGAVTWCEYDPMENKALPAGVAPNDEIEVKVGDLLFTRKNTYELIAACALVRATPPRRLMSDLIFRLRLHETAKIDPLFLQQLLVYPTKRKEIQKLAGGSAGSMPNISKERLRSAAIETPPLALQREFAARTISVDRLKSASRSALAILDDVCAALQHRAFQGEL